MSAKSDTAAPGTAHASSAYRNRPTPGTRRRGAGADAIPHVVRVRRLNPDRELRELVLLTRYPVFALAPGRIEDVHFLSRRNGQPVRVSVGLDRFAGDGLTQATCADADALIPLIAELTALKNEGQSLPRDLALRPCDALHALGRARGGRQVRLLAEAYKRLTATAVIITEGTETWCFTSITRFECPAGDRGPWRITLAPEILAEVEAGRILKLDPAALRLKGLVRRVYGLARTHTGGRYGFWDVDLGHLARLCPWNGTWRRFRRRIADIAAAQLLPGFVLTLEERAGRPTLCVARAAMSPPMRTGAPAIGSGDFDDLAIFGLQDPAAPALDLGPLPEITL